MRGSPRLQQYLQDRRRTEDIFFDQMKNPSFERKKVDRGSPATVHMIPVGTLITSFSVPAKMQLYPVEKKVQTGPNTLYEAIVTYFVVTHCDLNLTSPDITQA